MTTAIVIDILEECLLESADTLYPDGWRLQLDNAPTHTARQTQRWLQDNGVTVLDWPANSVDLAPIETSGRSLRGVLSFVGLKTSTNLRRNSGGVAVAHACDLSPYVERMSSRICAFV